MPKITYDLTSSSNWNNLSGGEHSLQVVAKATGYLDSAKSTSVSFTKGEEIPQDLQVVELLEVFEDGTTQPSEATFVSNNAFGTSQSWMLNQLETKQLSAFDTYTLDNIKDIISSEDLSNLKIVSFGNCEVSNYDFNNSLNLQISSNVKNNLRKIAVFSMFTGEIDANKNYVFETNVIEAENLENFNFTLTLEVGSIQQIYNSVATTITIIQEMS